MSNELKPQIRFKGFEDDWENTIIDKILSIGNGHDYKHLQNGQIPVFGTGGLMTFVSEFLYEGETVFIGRKGTIDKPMFYEGKFWTVDTLFYTYNFTNSIPRFVYPMFQTINWYSYNAATGVPSLSKETIKEIKINIPKTINEQKNIGSYFANIESLISETEREIGRLEKLNKASLQKMFPRPGTTTPEIRFAGFTEPWNVGKLSDILETNDIRNTGNKYGREDVLSVSGDCGLVNQIEFQGRSFAGASLLGYKITKPGQVIYTKSPLKAKPFGIIKSNQYGIGIISPLYAVYNSKEDNVADFVHYYFALDTKLNNYLRPLINKGAKNTILISDETALNGEIVYPSGKEQKFIADYFIKLDKLLVSKRQKLDKLRQIKQACLDKMFIN